MDAGSRIQRVRRRGSARWRLLRWLRRTACAKGQIDEEHAGQWGFALGQVAHWLEMACDSAGRGVEAAALRAVRDACIEEAARAHHHELPWRARALELAARKIATLA